MTELSDIAKENEVNLENCVVFIRGNDDILAVDISNAGIRQRSDDTMGFTFSITPKQALKLEEYFNKFTTGEKFYFDISQTGYRPVYYRGLSPMTKEIRIKIQYNIVCSKGYCRTWRFLFCSNMWLLWVLPYLRWYYV